MGRQKVSLADKVRKELPDFDAEVASLSNQELESRLAQLAKEAERVEQAKEDDEDLESTRAKAVELAAPYRDAKKMICLKSRYIISLIKE